MLPILIHEITSHSVEIGQTPHVISIRDRKTQILNTTGIFPQIITISQTQSSSLMKKDRIEIVQSHSIL